MFLLFFTHSLLFRAANKAATNVYRHIREDGGQVNVIDDMQTREELYRSIDYYAYENRLDQLFNK
jgi:methylisocitrate lyase